MTNKDITAGGSIFEIPAEYMDKLVGVEAEGAIPNGRRVVKVLAESGDIHEVGSLATVMGSHAIDLEDGRSPMIGYIVEWDDLPGRPGFVLGMKVREVTADEPAGTSVAH